MTTDYQSLADETLLRLIVHARPEALSALYDRYSRLVFSLALQAVGDPASAEEITQDVFLRVWQRAAQYRAEAAKVSTWLSSIARYRAIDWLRRQGVRPEGRSVAWADVPPDEVPVAESTEQAVELAIQRQQVRAAVAQLPEEQQRVLAMAYFQGLSQSEIAQALGLPLGTVKTRLRLAMDKLRGMLVTGA